MATAEQSPTEAELNALFGRWQKLDGHQRDVFARLFGTIQGYALYGDPREKRVACQLMTVIEKHISQIESVRKEVA